MFLKKNEKIFKEKIIDIKNSYLKELSEKSKKSKLRKLMMIKMMRKIPKVYPTNKVMKKTSQI